MLLATLHFCGAKDGAWDFSELGRVTSYSARKDLGRYQTSSDWRLAPSCGGRSNWGELDEVLYWALCWGMPGWLYSWWVAAGVGADFGWKGSRDNCGVRSWEKLAFSFRQLELGWRSKCGWWVTVPLGLVLGDSCSASEEACQREALAQNLASIVHFQWAALWGNACICLLSILWKGPDASTSAFTGLFEKAKSHPHQLKGASKVMTIASSQCISFFVHKSPVLTSCCWMGTLTWLNALLWILTLISYPR